MITQCPKCGGLRADPGEMFGGKPCECLLASSTCSPKVLVTLREVLKLVRRIRDYDSHPSHCDHIHLHATEAIEMLEIAISENSVLGDTCKE